MKFEGVIKIEVISNVANEVLFVGSIYKQPDLLIEYGHYVRSKYDFSDEATRFFFDNAEIIYKTRTQTFNKTTISTYFAEDTEKLSAYKKYGGWKTIENWTKLAITSDIKNYSEVLKKYSLLREYQRNGFDIEKIVSHKRFEEFTAHDIYRLIRGKTDRIHTVILTNEEAQVLNSGTTQMLKSCMEKPDFGIPIPYRIMNEEFRGFKTKTAMAVGMLSNAGKSRFMTKLIAYITLVLKQKTFVLLNEMSIEEIKQAMVTTAINNPEFQALHGIKINKTEKEITLGLYKDKKGEIIYRKTDDDGNPIESTEEYIERVEKNSPEYSQIMKIAEWIENETNEFILAKDVSGGYDDKTLEFEIRKAHLTHGVQYFFYDTFKQDIQDTGDWAAMKATATKFSQLMKELDSYGYLSIQLTDDTNIVKPDELTSSNIANCKGIKHLLDSLILFKEIPTENFHKYGYIQEDETWGNGVVCDLKSNKRYYVANIDKNRKGNKPKLIFEVDLNYNTWIECGRLVRK